MITHFFHGDDVIPSPPETALFHIIPVPLEQSVSYGTGTANGPKAILEASCQLELFDGKSTPSQKGIYTHPFVNCSSSINTTLMNISSSVSSCLEHNQFPILLGGEHTVTLGAISALQEKHDDFGVIQFDAHADLRESYEGSRYSHACVMKRIFNKKIPILQIGTRSYSKSEHDLREKNNIPYFNADSFYHNDIKPFQLPKKFPKKVFITFDIDGLDPSIIPATGTPVPGGLSWHLAMQLLEKIINERICIGFDVVELAPIPNLHHCNFTAAQLVYNTMGFLTRSPVNQKYWNI